MLLHFWYTAWPDHKPPDSPSMLLELIKEVELRRFRADGITPRGPVVVHCRYLIVRVVAGIVGGGGPQDDACSLLVECSSV